MLTLLADCETDGLLHTMSKFHCLALGEPGKEVTVYADDPDYPPISEGLDRMAKADRVVFHNGIGFDFWAITHFYPHTLRLDQIRDTLILSRMDDPTRSGHSLAAWGERLGCEKLDFHEYDTFTPTMAEYCRRDVEVLDRIWKRLSHYAETEPSILEHRFAFVIQLQEQHGFRLDVEKAQLLEAELREEQIKIEHELQDIFPPKTIERYSDKTGKRLKDKIEVFNPGSRKQIAERLIEKYNWKPAVFTPSGSPQVDEKILKTLPFPEAEALTRYFRVSKQLGQIADGDAAWLKLERDGYVHGRVNTLGAISHRCSHSTPNLAQVDKKDLRMREVWIPDENEVLVGVDAEGLELRMLASYLSRYDNGEYANALLNGDKSDGTDVHSKTQKLLQLKTRDGAKEAMYACLYGCSDKKLWEIMRKHGTTLKSGKEGRTRLESGITGLDKLVSAVKAKYRQDKKLRGIDGKGRVIHLKSEHSALNALLQSAGSICMKKALVVFHFDLAANAGHVDPDTHHPMTFSYCANVHDEVQLSVRPECAEELGQMFAQAITKAGEELGVRCRLDGAYDIGQNWKETH